MKILLVDDAPEKLHDISALLLAVDGVAASDVKTCTNGMDARALLAEGTFDLLVLDIRLPFRSDEEPDRRGGINLLSELTLSGRFRCPTYVVAVTGFEDLRREFESRFNNGFWVVDVYDPTDVGWRDRLRARTQHILKVSEQATRRAFKHDLCILTALDAPELNAIRSLPWRWSSAKALDDVSFYYEGNYSSDGRAFSVVALAAPRMGMVASATAAYKAIDILRPKLLAMAGICAGIRGACELGDAIVGDPCWDWQMGKKAEGGFEIAPDQIAAPLDISQIFALIRQDRAKLFQIAEAFQGDKPKHVPSIHIGPVASGSAVLADETTAGTIRDQQHRKLLGVDMELYGVYSAARDSSAPRPRTFGVKAVCDYADAEKNDNFQKYAAHISAQVLAIFAERFSAQVLV